MNMTRRSFLSSSAFALAIPGARSLGASLSTTGKWPLGLQLYSVKEMLAKEYDGTLTKIASLGYREVEAAGFFGRSAQQVRSSMTAAGLRCVSAHYTFDDLSQSLEKTISYGRELGLQNIICSFPGFRDPARVMGKSYEEKVAALTLDDLRWSADHFNEFGRTVMAAGMRFGYHNHTVEFALQNGVIPFDEMIRLTDPRLVTFELDCGWVIIGGADPVHYLKKYPQRISLLHIKDFKAQSKPFTVTDSPLAAELGRGIIPNQQILAAARSANIEHCFVEQEGYDMDPIDALRLDAQFMRAQNA